MGLIDSAGSCWWDWVRGRPCFAPSVPACRGSEVLVQHRIRGCPVLLLSRPVCTRAGLNWSGEVLTVRSSRHSPASVSGVMTSETFRSHETTQNARLPRVPPPSLSSPRPMGEAIKRTVDVGSACATGSLQVMLPGSVHEMLRRVGTRTVPQPSLWGGCGTGVMSSRLFSPTLNTPHYSLLPLSRGKH